MVLDEQNPITYKDYVSQYEVGDNKVISDLTGDALNQTIYDWYKYRYLSFVDTDKFRDILRRTISVALPRYEQLLRIEPGVAEYDWLVGVYRERQLKRKSDHELETSRGKDQVQSTGTDTDVGTITHTHGTINDIKGGAISKAHTGTVDDTKTGGHDIDSVSGRNTTTYSPHVSKKTTNGGDRQAWSGDQSLASNLPMSESYNKFIEPTDSGSSATGSGEFYEHAYQHMPALDWSAPSSQSQAGHREYVKDGSTVTESFEYGDGVKGDITVTEGDKANPATNKFTYNNEKNSKEFNDTETTTYQNLSNTRTQDNDSDNRNLTKTNNNTTTKTYGNINVTGNGNITDREQVTGRDEDPARILKRASNFIRTTNAFEWLRHEIEPCFLALYDID